MIKKREIKDPLTDEPLVDFFDTFRKLRSLINILPKDVKDNIIIKKENILEVTDGERSKIENRIGTTPINLLIEGDWEMHQERNRIFSIILIERLEAVVGEVAVLLHEKLIKEVSKNETL